jgi:nucleotide-binding universal stress UspA family protein
MQQGAGAAPGGHTPAHVAHDATRLGAPPRCAQGVRMEHQPRSIMVAVEAPAEARATVAVAASLAAALGAELIVAGVVPLAPPGLATGAPGDVGELAEQLEQQQLVERLVQERLDEIVGEQCDGVRTRTHLTYGPAGPAIAAAAREQDVDLIVMPMRREGELGHLVHDHADRHVLHHSDVPVLVVPTSAAAAGVGDRR